eukprot:17082-Heterococcus_DN1.PRE.1
MQLGSFRPVNREALHLYRDILRSCKRFHWCNEKGEPWSELLRQSARKEFEQAREENGHALQEERPIRSNSHRFAMCNWFYELQQSSH